MCDSEFSTEICIFSFLSFFFCYDQVDVDVGLVDNYIFTIEYKLGLDKVL